MSDNTTLNIGIGGDIIATEDPGLGYKIPVSKIRIGATNIDGGDVTISNPFPTLITDGYHGQVSVAPSFTAATTSNSALVMAFSPNSPLPSGSNNIGTVNVAVNETYRVLGQVSPTANTLTPAFTVPSSTSVQISSIVVCNTNNTSTTFRVSIQVAGASDNIKQYLYYDLPISDNDTFVATIDITMAATDILAVQAGMSGVVFNIFGVEIT
jgi:hypothetical protein